ncbi:MAG: hypothetical protein ABI605_03615 [Rhizobacter sp.]
MTTPPLAFGTSVAPPSDRGGAQLSLASGRSDELYALWKNVFDRAHAVQHSAQPRRVATAAERDADPYAVAALPAMPGAVVSSSAAVDPSPHMQPAVLDDAARPAAQALPVPARSERDHDAAAAMALPTGAVSVNSDTAPESPVERGRADAVQFAATQVHDAAGDSVSVHVQGTAVSIVVRDAALSEQEALRLGFETARRLTGQRASLAQLTLNGHVAYQQPGASDEVGSALVFIC